MEWLFWLLLVGLVYSYFLYPILLKLVLAVRPRSGPGIAPEQPLPSMTLVVTVHNESQRIRDKLANSLAIDYPAELLEVIVASDCSTDDTDDIVANYAPGRVRLVRADQRKGKEYAQLCAIREAQGEVIVFSDVATQIPADALRKLAGYFADPSVGAVSSEDRFVTQDGRVVGEGAYVRYEMWLRRLESKLAGLVGLSGSFFAARRTVCERWDTESPSDFNTALNCARADLRAVTAPDVLGFYTDLKDPSREYARKVRTVLRGMTGLARHREVMNPQRFGWFAFEVISHKLMRWAVPWFMLGLLIVNAVVAHEGAFYALCLIGQLLFYGVAAAAHFQPALREHSLVRIIYFFVQVNLAIADATGQFLSGKRMTVWQPSAR